MRSPRIPPAPEPPSPYRVSEAQSAADISSAISTALLSNANEENPEASMRFEIESYAQVEQPRYDTETGEVIGTTIHQIPRFKRVVTLSPKNQILYDQQQETSEELNSLGLNLARQINNKTATPFTLDGLPSRAIAPASPAILTSAPSPGALIRTLGDSDYAAERQSMVDSINERLQWQIDIDREAIKVALEHKGIYPGSEAFEREMRVFTNQVNDARLRAYIAGSEEHERLVNMKNTKARFANDAQQLDLQQQIIVITTQNSENIRRFQILLQLAEFTNNLRQTAIQELTLSRSQTISEIGALIHGTKVDMPNFAQFRAQPIAQSQIGQFIYQSAAMEQQQWQTQVQVEMQRAQMRNQMIGSIIGAVGGIAGAAIGAPAGGPFASMFGGR